ncbi:hypothetical protein LINPERHAP1_LOCUS29400 [Linum perenne]
MKDESLWIAWIHTYRMRGKDVWTCISPTSASWIWK